MPNGISAPIDARMRRRAFLAGIAAVTAASTHAQSSEAFPTKPITLICPLPAGGTTDIVLRALADAAGKELGQHMIVDNRAGASGVLGPAAMAANAQSDGYTIAQMPITTVRMPLMQATTFDTLRDFTYVAMLASYEFTTAVRGDSPFKSWPDIVNFAKERPGKLSYGHTGRGTTLHIGMEMIAARSGVAFTHVPFRGETEAIAALLGGHVDLITLGTGHADLISTDQIKPINVWARQRSPVLPDVPTLNELGYPFEFDSPWGIAGPKGMHGDVVDKLQNAFKAALSSAHVRSVMDKYRVRAFYLNAQAYRAFVGKQIEQERSLLLNANLLWQPK